MKKLLTLTTLIFSLMMFSSTSFADWTEVGENIGGTTYYVDFERIRKHDGYVYFWMLIDFLKPTATGRLSHQTYYQGDCKLFRHKGLSYVFHNQPMGQHTGDRHSPTNPEWEYPSPDSIIELVLESVCDYVN